jgi:flagellar hook-basal body complex protein FliE
VNGQEGMVLEGILSGLGSAVLGTAVSSASSLAGSVAGSVAGAAAGATPFGGIFQSMVEQTSALDAKATQAVSGLLSGQGVEVHEAMMATQKADMAFELALQVRNKAVGAYQQMMGMQF